MRAQLADRTRLFQFGVVAIFAAPLLAHMYNGTFTRLMADDYCFAYISTTTSIGGAIIHWYNNWTGAFGLAGVLTVVVGHSPWLVAFYPAVLLAAWYVGLVWIIVQLCLLLRLRAPMFTALLSAALILYATVDGTASVFQSLYWASGSVTYVTPTILLTYYAGFVLYTIRRIPSGKMLVLLSLFSLIFAFITAGFSPVLTALEAGLLLLVPVLVLIFPPRPCRRTALPLLLSGLVGSVIAILVIFHAPGTAIRQSSYPSPPSVRILVVNDLWLTGSFTATDMVIFAPVPLIVTLVFSGVVTNKLYRVGPETQLQIRRRSRRLLALSAFLCIGLLLVLFLPSSYLFYHPGERSLIVPHFILVLTTVSWGVIMGLSLQKPGVTGAGFSRLSLAVLTLVLLVGPIRSTWTTLALTPQLRTFAAEWDTREQTIRAAADAGVQALDLPHFSADLADLALITSLSSQPHVAFNACAENYYGVPAITVH